MGRGFTRDLMLDIPAGDIPGQTSTNKYGYSPSGVQTSRTDIWDRADAAVTQRLWNAPAGAVPHSIVSTSALDTNTGPGVGANKVQIFGLTDWDTAEVSEIVNLSGTSAVQTVNNYAIIHRIKVIEYGILGPNAGTITATEAPVVTAQINQVGGLGEGQTQMAVYGIPSIQTAYLTNWYASMHERLSATATVKLLYAIDPVNAPSQFIVKETRGLCSDGTSAGVWEKRPYTQFAGPGILKVQAIASANDQDMAAGFDLILVDN